jgi:predicted GNAT family acetyltransferase
MALKITNNSLKHRFETEVGTRTAFLAYRLANDLITFTHTQVPPALEGRGIGTALAKAGLKYAQQRTLRVVPQCPFVAEFIQSHPQYKPLVAS